MNIDRSNYEVWFIDWLDGKLNSFQTGELFRFLDLNTDLKEEFNDLASISRLSAHYTYPHKDGLKKSVEEISDTQFGYLCAARLENDLSELQKSEIDEIIANDPRKKTIFDQINKARLSPLNINYKHKKQLLKRTPSRRIVRLSIIGLSAAAAITLILTTYLTAPLNLQDNKVNEAAVIIPENNLNKQSTEKIPEIIESVDNKRSESPKIKVAGTEIFKPIQGTSQMAAVAENNNGNSATGNYAEAGVEKIKIIDIGMLSQNTDRYELASSYIYVADEEPETERNKFGRYIAKTFREKILKEKTPADSPLKAYEIAEAGVSGINKIFGWEMALDKKNDGNGNLKSVYFSSRIIKFNAPVKKSEPLP
jgi:hypothetical protein